VAWISGIWLFQLAVAPQATVAYLQLTWLRPAFEVNSVSPFAIHPGLWLGVSLVLAGLALRYADARLGWALAVVFTVMAYPRLLVYQLMSLLAAFGGPEPSAAVTVEYRGSDRPPVPVTERTTGA
jgi:hypothetical protein